MKSYLLLGISVLLLLFILPKPPQTAGRWASPEQSVLKKACNKKKYTTKRTCQKKCLRHQTHSSPENNAGTAADCGPTFYALPAVPVAAPVVCFFPAACVNRRHLAVDYLPPALEREPNPPRVA